MVILMKIVVCVMWIVYVIVFEEKVIIIRLGVYRVFEEGCFDIGFEGRGLFGIVRCGRKC